MPVSEGNTKVTAKAEPDQLFIISVCVSVRSCRPRLDKMRLVVEGVSYSYLRNYDTVFTQQASVILCGGKSLQLP